MKSNRSRPLSTRHAELSAGVVKVPSGWKAKLLPIGVHAWRLVSDDSIQVMTSMSEYGPVGLWWLVSVTTYEGSRPRPPTRSHIDLARQTFCARDARTEEHASESGVWYIWQRLSRGAWKVHPEFARIEAKRVETGLPDLSFPPDLYRDPGCPRCSNARWLRQSGLDEAGTPRPILQCAECEAEYDPAELHNLLLGPP